MTERFKIGPLQRYPASRGPSIFLDKFRIPTAVRVLKQQSPRTENHDTHELLSSHLVVIVRG